MALILGEDELVQESITIKPLRGGEQRRVALDQLETHLKDFQFTD